jgi:ribose-phosphate pyrophosphokinase
MIRVNGKEVEFKTFPNGETKLIEESIERNINLLFPKVSFKYENDSDLIKLMFVKNYLDSLTSMKNVTTTLTIYYMPYSRMDRSENKSAFTLKYVANFINSLKFDKVIVVEPHSDVTNALIEKVEPVYTNYTLLPLVEEAVGFNSESDYIVFPDAGASKRYTLKNHNILVGNKHRDFQTGRITKLEVMGQYAGGRKAIIMDDLSSYGGTFILTAQALKDMGVKEVYLLVTHAEDSIFDGQVFKTDLIDGVFTTNTIMSKNGIWLNKQYDSKLTVYEIEGVLSND